MITVRIPNNLSQELTKPILDDIVAKVFPGVSSYSITNENHNIGRYITAESETSVHYICISNPSNDARNARLMQFIAPAFVAYWQDKNANKFFDIYLLNPDNTDKNSYSQLFYRCFLTLGFQIFNLNQLNLNLHPFTSYDDLKRYREENRDRNPHNRSTYFEEIDDSIAIYGKTFGANAMESFILTLVLRRLLPQKRIIFHPVLDNDETDLSVKQQEILTSLKIEYGTSISEANNNDVLLDAAPDRDTPKFHYNLMRKYGAKQCLLCGCNMEHMIIGSHIERVADIKKNNAYTDDEKRARIINGDNGLWLCANHDKMFEYGLIFFQNRNLVINPNLAPDAREFITKSIPIKNFQLPENLFNEQMANFLQCHCQRIGIVEAPNAKKD